MKSPLTYFAIVCLAFATVPINAQNRGIVNTTSSPHAKLRSIDMDDVRWTDGFWADKFNLCRDVTVHSIYESLQNPKNAAYLPNFKVAASPAKGKHTGKNWGDGDCYKWIETASHVYAITKDKKLNQLMDQWIALIAKTQAPDGYISTNIQLTGRQRLTDPHHHEIYNMGHLLNTACIHYRATGKRNFLNIAIKLGDFLYKTFQPRPPELAHFGWNPSNIMGLAELYRTTGDKRYLDLTKTFVDMRGSAPDGTDLTQDHVPLREENQAVGHCVCAAYLYSGAADLCAETGDKALHDALKRIWHNIAKRRMYITGAIGSFWKGQSTRGDDVHEAFGSDYQLPNRTAYTETCSNIGNAMFNQRMLTLTGQARFTDIAEQVMFNSMLSAWGADGKTFFYANPLKRNEITHDLSKHHTAQRWQIHDCYCCPPQVARTIAKLHNWFYSVSDDGLWINHYGSNTLDTQLPDGQTIKLTQQTKYPWDGDIKITLQKAPKTKTAIMLRIPAWTTEHKLKVNDKDKKTTAKPGSYFTLQRNWSAGDTIQLNLPMEIRFMQAHPAATNLRDKIAIMRGPVVYCLDLPLETGGRKTWDNGIFLPENARFTPYFDKSIAGGLMTLKGKALTHKGKSQFAEQTANIPHAPEKADWTNTLYQPFKGRKLPKPKTQ
ncbi:MAG: glycoside hydrolase family 127 protein, partial [Planctomycetota bacterium]